MQEQETQLATQMEPADLATRDEMSVTAVMKQVAKVQEIMHQVMKPGEHFGTIPGCGDKPTLLKSGAEKLGFTFRLMPRYIVERIDMGNDHREYSVTCELFHVNTGNFVGSGVGCCSTKEAKYRFRTENTGRAVPGEYWKHRDKSLLGGPQYQTRKINKQWAIVERIEHDNPADYWNTILKMAKKRAHVDAILTTTAASDIFTQDVEDLAANGVLGKQPETNGTTDTPDDAPPVQQPQRQSEQGMDEIAAKKLFESIVLVKAGQKSMAKDKLRAILAQVQQLSHLTAIADCARWLDQHGNISDGQVQINETPMTASPERAELESFCIGCCAAGLFPTTTDYKTFTLQSAEGLDDPNEVCIALSTFQGKNDRTVMGKTVAELSDKAVTIALAKARKLEPELLAKDSQPPE